MISVIVNTINITKWKDRAYVFDTSILVEAPKVFQYALPDGLFVVPLVVIHQLDYLKKSENENLAKKVRMAIRQIEEYSDRGSLHIETNYIPIELLENNADNKVIGTALWLKKVKKVEPFLVTTDINMRVVSKLVEIHSLDSMTIDSLVVRGGGYVKITKHGVFYNPPPKKEMEVK